MSTSPERSEATTTMDMDVTNGPAAIHVAMDSMETSPVLEQATARNDIMERSHSSQSEKRHKKEKEPFDVPSNIRHLIKNMPEVQRYINDLQNQLLDQQNYIKKLKKKAHKKKEKINEVREKELEETAVEEEKHTSREEAKAGSPKKDQHSVKEKPSALQSVTQDNTKENKFSWGVDSSLTAPYAVLENRKDDVGWDVGAPLASQTMFQEKESDAGASLNAKPMVQEDNMGWDVGASLADQVREAAEDALQESGFVYHESLGLYYDRGTGYYYDQNTGLYYDGINKTYYTYDETTNLFHVYHQVIDKPEVVEEKDEETILWEQELKKRKKAARQRAKENKARRREEKSEEEEGECSESSESEHNTPYVTDNTVASEVLERDPCLRLMVVETQVKGLKVGTLFIITVTGGTLGREGDSHAVCIPDINVSKHHAVFTFDKGQYCVKDLGSRNGTYLDGHRLSVALSESEDSEIKHCSELRFGSTRLSCHIHPGTETCGHCEPGLVQQDSESTELKNATDKEAKHREELLRLRRRFALTGLPPVDPSVQVEQAGYQDRASERRKVVGSMHHGAKTESASLDQSVPTTNKGFKMLSKMGWQSGQALGKDGTGNIEPVPLSMKTGKAGLGAADFPEPLPVSSRDKRKNEAWARARERYQHVPYSGSDATAKD